MNEQESFENLFAPEPVALASAPMIAPWKILLVDDEPDIHAVLRLALQDIVVEGRSLQLLDTKSIAETKACLADHPDIALILLDVVMETEHAGLDLVRYIRRDLDNNTVQIVLVTGQPGYAPQREVVAECAIDGYRLKSELTADKIFVSVYVALRAYQALNQLEAQHTQLETLTHTLGEVAERLRSVVDTAPDAIILADENTTVTGWNPGAERLFGYSASEMMGQSLACLMPERHRQGHHAALTRLHAGENPRMLGKTVEVEGLRRNGEEFPIELVLGSWDSPTGRQFSAVMRDISERKKSEAELNKHRHHLERLVEDRTTALSKAKDAAEAANRAKSTFLANMSHELRTPMNAIMGMTAIALRHATDPKLHDQLSKVIQASQHLLHVINDILDMSKIEAEHLTLEQVPFKFGEVLENIISLSSLKAQDKHLKLVVDLPPEVAQLSLQGDPLRLGQILINLTGNALKFTEHGAITVRARITEDNPNNVLLRCEVEDTGIGILAKDQKRLFTAFEQADGSMTRKYGGTGLGLAISKRLVNLMGGEVGVESVEGQGSTFWFAVRLGKASSNPESLIPSFENDTVEARLTTRYAGTRILLAEDEPINQEVSRGLLEDVGLVVDLAEDGGQAFELAKQYSYPLILMDMQMPHLNGVDATRVIRALPGYAQTPILAMTANAFDEDRQVCLDAGMNDHISKPVDPEVLFETLLKWLSKSHTSPRTCTLGMDKPL